MRASRGMGAIAPSKMPTGKVKPRRDNTDFTQFAKGGEVWDKERPKGLGKPKALSPAKKAKAKAMAKAIANLAVNRAIRSWTAGVEG